MKKTLYDLVTCANRSPQEIIKLAKHMQPADIADVFNELDNAQDVLLFRMLPKDIATDVFVSLDSETQQGIIESMSDKEQSYLINDLFSDDAAELIDEMPPSIVRRLLQNATPETRADINHLLKYDNDSAGGLMTMDYIRLKDYFTVKDSLEIIRRFGADKKVIYTCYVTDQKKTLLGYVSVKSLLISDPETKISQIMNDTVVSVSTSTPHDEIAQAFKKYGYLALAVTDKDHKLVGVITADDIIESIEEQHTEVINKMSAVRTSDMPYLKTSVFQHSRNRVVWLLLLMLSAMVTGQVISSFQTGLEAVPLLVAFIPMLMGAGGNAGSQASTQIIRGLATGELETRDTHRVLWKEIRVAVICGIILGIVNFGRIILFDGVIKDALDGQMFRIATTVTLSLCCTLVMAKSLGSLLPMLARKFKIDPAIMAAPLIATILDTLSLLVYFGIATALLSL